MGGCRVLGFCVGGDDFDHSICGVMTIVALLALVLVFLGARNPTLLQRSASYKLTIVANVMGCCEVSFLYNNLRAMVLLLNSLQS